MTKNLDFAFHGFPRRELNPKVFTVTEQFSLQLNAEVNKQSGYNL
jgi:hypothetical protein